MKNLYLEKMKTLGLAAVLLLSASAVFGQVDVNWKGTSTDDADDLNNWQQLTNMAGNNVVVGHVGTYADPANPKHPVTRSDAATSIVKFSVAGPTAVTTTETDPVTGEPIVITYPTGKFTVDKPIGVAFSVNPANNSQSYTYLGGHLIVKSGTFAYNTGRNFYLENPNSRIIVENNGVVTTGLLLMGRNSGTLTGGQVELKGNGLLGCTNIDRFVPDVTQSLITISDNAKLRVNNDKRDYLKNRIFTTGQIRGGEGFVAYVYYDNVPNQTFVVAKSAAVPFIYTTDHMVMAATERLKANEPGIEIAILPNPAILTNAQSIVWKYGTSVDGPFDVIMDGMVTEKINPVFPSLGTYYLVCEVTKENGDKVVSSPRQYIISTDKVTLSPAAKQYLRMGQSTGVIAVVETGTATAREWKYTTTPGENYMSFEPAQTGTTLKTSFDAIGNYYVICESVVDGTPLRSKELEILVQKRSDGALNITWTGVVDDKWENMYNWNPYAYPDKNNAIVPVAGITNWPVFRSGVDTIYAGSSVAAGAKLYVRGNSIEDTLKWRGDTYGLVGELIVEAGVFAKEDVGLLRMTANTSTLRVSGTGVAIFHNWNGTYSNLSLANNDNNNTATTGGQLYVSGNGKLIITLPGVIHRITTNADLAITKMYISENGSFDHFGDQLNLVNGYFLNNRYVLPEGSGFTAVYDPVTNYTYVRSRDLAGFGITQTKSEHLSVDQLSAELTLDNASGLTGFEWLYGTSPFGPWQSFSTPVVGETAKVSFATAGTYFVICKAADGTLSNNVLRVVAYELPVIVSVVDGAQVLTVTLPAGATGVEWKNRLEGIEEYASITPPVTATSYTPLIEEFEVEGTYEAIYEATVKNDDGQPVVIHSKPISMVVSAEGIDVITTRVQGVKVEKLAIYPNPSTGTFNITASQGGRVEVLDLKGAVIMSKTVVAGAQPITVSAKGVYLVKVIDGAQVKIGRVVVK
jgi:hypothetical protein